LNYEFNDKNKSFDFSNKREIFSLYKSLKKERSLNNTRDRLSTLLKVFFNKRNLFEKNNRIKYFFQLIPILVLIIYLIIGSPFYNPNTMPNSELLLSENLDELINIDFSKIKFKNKSEQIQFYLKLAIISKETENLKAEIFALEKLSSLDSKNLDLKLNLAQKLTKQAFGIVTIKSRKLVREILEVNSSQPDALYLAGLTAFQNNRSDLAEKIWLRILELDPNSKYKQLIEEKIINKTNTN
jgi:tetratricopeptide (TPR) repeat protein